MHACFGLCEKAGIRPNLRPGIEPLLQVQDAKLALAALARTSGGVKKYFQPVICQRHNIPFGRVFWDREYPAPTLCTSHPAPCAHHAKKNVVIPKDRRGLFHLNVCFICSFPSMRRRRHVRLSSNQHQRWGAGSVEGTCGLEIARRSKNTTKGKTSRAFSTCE